MKIENLFLMILCLLATFEDLNFSIFSRKIAQIAFSAGRTQKPPHFTRAQLCRFVSFRRCPGLPKVHPAGPYFFKFRRHGPRRPYVEK